jgi:hypothetical protein
MNAVRFPKDREFLDLDGTAQAVQTLNNADEERLAAGCYILRPEGYMPFRVTLPYSSKPHDEFDSWLVNNSGYACGVESSSADDALLAEVTRSPVITLPAPSRTWRGTYDITAVQDWRHKTDEEKDQASIAIFDSFAVGLYDALMFAMKDVAPKNVAFYGSSLASATSLALANRVMNAANVTHYNALAMPNTIERNVYGELLLRDFAHCVELPGGIPEQVRQGVAPYQAAIAARKDPNARPSKLRENLDVADYFINDMVGGLFFKSFGSNQGLARALSRPTGSRMAARLTKQGVIVHIAFLDRDPVAPPTTEHFQDITDPNFTLSVYGERDHAGCLNPYIMADVVMAGKIS